MAPKKAAAPPPGFFAGVRDVLLFLLPAWRELELRADALLRLREGEDARVAMAAG